MEKFRLEKNRFKKAILIVLSISVLFLLACERSPADGKGTKVIPGNGQGVSSLKSDDPKSVDPESTGDVQDTFGTRQSPVPLDTKVEVGPEWNISVTEIVPDAWDIIKQENQFNKPPEEGYQFVMAKIQVSYVGEESGTPWINLSFKYLGSDNNVYGNAHNVLPNSFSGLGEQFPGATAEGYISWSIPSDVVKDGSIMVEESFSFESTRVFFEGVR